MKNFLFVLLLFPLFVSAQKPIPKFKYKFMHTHGVKALDAFLGISQHGFLGGLGFAAYLDKKWYIKGACSYERATLADHNYKIRINSVALDAYPAFAIFNSEGKFYVNLTAGGSVVLVESVVTEQYLGDRNKEVQKHKWGLLTGVELEYYVAQSLSIIGTFSQKYYFPSTVYGDLRWFLTTGVRYSFKSK